jgi:hypothetical protein
MIGRRGRPGLVGMAARTAVVAGTATAVSGRVAHNQQQRYASQEEEQYAAAAEAQAEEQARVDAAVQQALAAQQAQQAAAATVASTAPAGGNDVVAQIQQLAALRDQGILTEEEFAAKKAKLLGI